ncbi:unnamed protein product [Rhodiola kirilowii]
MLRLYSHLITFQVLSRIWGKLPRMRSGNALVTGPSIIRISRNWLNYYFLMKKKLAEFV